jgi:RNA polymerase sigma factor (sigma-70 family)
MSTTDSQELLREYVREHSEDAFEQLVRRYIDLVYSVALRRVNGASLLAQDVSQLVFTDLARKAASLPADVMLGGWLHHHTCFLASSTLRAEQRRLEREKQALEMNALNASSDSDWKQLAPVLDHAIDQLEPADRNAIILRFFEQRDLRTVGAVLGASEDAAQKRVSRALEKLRTLLEARGVTLSLAGLGAILGVQAVEAAPTGLAADISKGALPAGAAVGFIAALLKPTAATALKLVSVAAALAVLIGGLAIYRHTPGRPATILASAPIATQKPGTPSVAQGLSPADAIAISPGAAAASSNVLHLVVVAADSGRPVPIVQIDYRGCEGEKYSGKTLRATRFGLCDVEIPKATITQLELTTRIDGFADTRLHWEQSRVKAIPATYTLRLVRPVSIGGRVIDPDGRPVAGAKVGFNHEDSPTSVDSPEDHHFGWIEVSTDTNGNWRIERIASEMLRLLYGSASHPDYVQSAMGFAARKQGMEEELREGTMSFQLGRAVTVHGIVIDSDGGPITGAKVLVGKRGMSDSRSAESGQDGSFTVNGCRPGKSPLSAEAEGFAATTTEVELSSNAQPFRLILQRGKSLMLRLVSQSGQPVPKAYIWLDTMNQLPVNNPDYGKLPVQADFDGKPDADGRVVWNNAPDTELTFDIAAGGFMRKNGVKVRPDGEEHVIVLPPAVVVSGTVRDATSGQPIPRFKIVTGWPVTNFLDHSVSGRWSSFERDWLTFSDGQFRHAFEEALLYGQANPGYMLRFEAEGHAPFISRPIQADETEVQLDVKLRPAAETIVSVLLPDNRPAAQADVGLAMPQAGLQLVLGGFAHQNVQNGAALLMADASGNFRLPSDDSITRIVIAHPAGFTEVTRATLVSDPTVRLEPWGRLEGTYLAGGQPATNRDLLFQYGQAYSDAVSCSFEAYRTRTDQAGRFVFNQVPPGKHKIVRLIPVGGDTLQHDPLADVEIRPGETTTATIGGDGYLLSARLRCPDGWKPQGQRVSAFIQTAPPPALAALINQTKVDPAVAAQVRQSPEVQEYARNSRHFQAVVADDFQAVSAEQLPPGDYILLISVMAEPTQSQSSGDRIAAQSSFTVPADPPSGTLDLGEISLHQIAGQK